ncbi:MAG: Tn3 transposase DDE domain protein [Pelotomaculum sp. PtaB.Bin117]|nr:MULTISPECIES: Tn3 family transposase [Pelotomaculum]OPX84621.1 MAG: Tn3 transposase DDE domain protein [Pelotomaculum sp. PtaB.Bin117]OPY63336.1 MAG: Tn3 transposase DDE domain protein [Pelotomaculum sp. PtaU1.Bin065]
MQIGVSALRADANPHYGSGKGATIYRFTSDQFSAFYTKIINTNARDAIHIIDGLLHHETDALQEMGCIEKTIFILDYISSEAMRRRIQKGLNKGEAMNALARAIFFGKQGDFRERALQDQLQRASALNILINAISIWNTVYLTEATKQLKTDERVKELLPHVSPLAWEHINFLGEYTFDLRNTTTLDSLRPLQTTI